MIARLLTKRNAASPLATIAPFVLTLTLSLAVAVHAADPANSQTYPPMPEAVSSFGATVVDKYAYIFGGHMGRVAGNSKEGLCPHFSRLDLTNPASGWEDLPMLEPSQSPGLVAWNGKVYRVGGLSFKNSTGQPTAFHSLDIFARFDPATKTWTRLEPLPVPRSSLDAAVVDGKLYVVGGWNLQEGSAQDAAWHEDVLVFDLTNEKSTWKPVAKPPFKTRALATVAHQHKLYVLGGMKSTNQTTNDVHVYDPATDQWSKGPELPIKGNFNGFALAAFSANGKLYVSGGSGMVFQINAKSDGWEPIERLFFNRMFHRLVVGPSGEIVLLGGVGNRVYLSNVEVLRPADSKTEAAGRMKSMSWTVEFPGKARHSQALVLHGSELYAFGGNTSTAPHDFDQENFSNEAFAFNLASRKVESLPAMPQAMQSGGAFVAGTRIDPSIYVVGGLAPGEPRFGPTDVIQQYRLRSKAWVDEDRKLPAPRSMFDLVTFERQAWIFGGSANRQLAAETLCWDPMDDQPVVTVAGAAIPTPRRSAAGAVLGNKYYAVGGLGEKTSIVDKAEVFDFETGKWSTIASPKISRVFASLAEAGGKLYLAGGFSRVDGHFAGTTAIEVYDPKTNQWVSVFQELAPTLSKMTMLAYQDRLLFYSVDRDKAGLAHFVLVDPAPQTEGYGSSTSQGEDRTAGQEIAAQLKSLDKNGDGKLSMNEVGPRFQALVKRIDANHDGVATNEEIEAFTKKYDEENRPQTGFGRGGRGERRNGEGRGGQGGGERKTQESSKSTSETKPNPKP